jgi:hypothetical protein
MWMVSERQAYWFRFDVYFLAVYLCEVPGAGVLIPTSMMCNYPISQ